jgi:hypothetical protein
MIAPVEAAIREQRAEIAKARESISAEVAAKLDEERRCIAAEEAQKARRAGLPQGPAGRFRGILRASHPNRSESGRRAMGFGVRTGEPPDNGESAPSK